MGALLGFAPFIGFAVIENLFGIVPGLVVGALISIARNTDEELRQLWVTHQPTPAATDVK